MTRILFVDDDEFVLLAMRRLFMRTQSDWEFEFETNGANALELCERQHFDVVVSDMRMPSMDGASLLSKVAERFPKTIRIVLSGQSEREGVLRALGPAHQFLSKPCTLERLIPAIAQSRSLQDRFATRSGLEELVAKTTDATSLSTTALEAIDLLWSTNATLGQIGDVVSRDDEMASQIVRLANSPHINPAETIVNLPDALNRLGQDTLRPLILSLGVILQLGIQQYNGQPIAEFLNQQFVTALIARDIAIQATGDAYQADQALTAAMLKDVGCLLLEKQHTNWKDATNANAERELSVDTELQLVGATHGDIGGFLMKRWGLPCPVAEAVTFHQCPGESSVSEFGPLAALVAAQVVEREKSTAFESNEGESLEFLSRLGLRDRLDLWKTLQLNLCT